MAPAAHLDYLDGWRGLAIVFLLVGHFFPVPGINLGVVGVNLFFVLSGVLMARLLFIQQVPISLFYKRRISRIFPAVLVFVVLVVLVRLAAGARVDWAEVLAAVTFVNNYFGGVRGAAAMPFGHFWSLCVEEHSYIALSLIAIVARRTLAGATFMVVAGALVTCAFAVYYAQPVAPGQPSSTLHLQSEAAAFGIFVSAALLLCLQGRALPRLPALAYAALAGMGVALHWWSVPGPLSAVAGVATLALTVNLLFNAPPSVHAALSFGPLRQLGLWSFSLYVWQQPFYLLSRHQGWPAIAGLALAMGCGVASFYLIEKPARAWINRKWHAGTARQAAIQTSPL